MVALDAALPPDFDWKTYMLYHPDLQAVGITTELQAKEHYLKLVGSPLPSDAASSLPFRCTSAPGSNLRCSGYQGLQGSRPAALDMFKKLS